MAAKNFPESFIWGAATSAQQIEGGRHEGGRGESIWDRFAAEPGRIADGTNPDIACDHFHRMPEDVALMKELGLGGYRFSIAWPRIFPLGTGPVNSAGLDFYDALVDRLLEAGIRPFPTLYHWDLPQALQDKGGWAQRDIVDAFAGYAAAVAGRLGDRVKQWVTHNEPWCITVLGHEEGSHAPGHKDPLEALKVAHHLHLSHGRATRIIRQKVAAAEVGIVNNYCPAYPASDSEADHDAARWFDGFFNRWFLDPVFLGKYPEDAIADRVARGHLSGPEMSFVKEGDMSEISAPQDFMGINYYSRNVMRMNDKGHPEAVPMAPKDELTDMQWEVFPEGLYKSLIDVNRNYAPKKIYIAENGAAYDVAADKDGRFADTKRIFYLQQHLLAIHKAIAAGVPVDGYYAWTLLDNFEWALGYEKKFGLYAIEQNSLKRLPKDSAKWYRGVIAANAVDDSPLNPDFPDQGETRAN